MKKLLQYFMFWPVIKMLQVKCSDYWVKRTNADFLKYAQLIVDKYYWEISNKSEIPSLIQSVEDADKRSRYASLERDDEISKYRIETEFCQRDNKRFELEVTHLKDLVQEKNMVIDKLLAKLEIKKNKLGEKNGK